MKHEFKPGDIVRDGCENCRALVSATYSYGTLLLNDGTVIENVMRAVCNVCGEIVAVAHQSAPTIKAAREQRDARRDSAQ